MCGRDNHSSFLLLLLLLRATEIEAGVKLSQVLCIRKKSLKKSLHIILDVFLRKHALPLYFFRPLNCILEILFSCHSDFPKSKMFC